MLKLPFDDGEADLVLSYSGLHMVSDPERAVQELARCLKPGGQLIGTTFLAGETRRSRALFEIGTRQGHPLPPAREDLIRWLKDAGITSVSASGHAGSTGPALRWSAASSTSVCAGAPVRAVPTATG
jgi:SAM-dependent methyltransferase